MVTLMVQWGTDPHAVRDSIDSQVEVIARRSQVILSVSSGCLMMAACLALLKRSHIAR